MAKKINPSLAELAALQDDQVRMAELRRELALLRAAHPHLSEIQRRLNVTRVRERQALLNTLETFAGLYKETA